MKPPRHSLRIVLILCLASLLETGGFAAGTNEIPVLERKLTLDPPCRYLMLGLDTNATAPAAGYGLILILPGGDGGDGFLPFCKEMKKWGLPADFIAAELIAPKWKMSEDVVWPTKITTKLLKEKDTLKAEDIPQATTEDFIEEVIDDARKICKIDPRYVFTISWSSGGPAAYVAALSSRRVTGSFVAMSVFKPEWLPPLTAAKGRAFYLYHSPDDQVCPFSFAEEAKKVLVANGAVVELKTYPGGHGWRPFTYYFDTVKSGIEWLRLENKASGK